MLFSAPQGTSLLSSLTPNQRLFHPTLQFLKFPQLQFCEAHLHLFGCRGGEGKLGSTGRSSCSPWPNPRTTAACMCQTLPVVSLQRTRVAPRCCTRYTVYLLHLLMHANVGDMHLVLVCVSYLSLSWMIRCIYPACVSSRTRKRSCMLLDLQCMVLAAFVSRQSGCNRAQGQRRRRGVVGGRGVCQVPGSPECLLVVGLAGLLCNCTDCVRAMSLWQSCSAKM